MASGKHFDLPDNGVQNYQGKVTWYVVWACFIAASGGALYGYDKGIAGGVSGMDPFLLKFYPDVYAANHASGSNGTNDASDDDMYCNYNNYELQWFSSSLWLAGAFFCVPAGYIARRWGRLRAMLIAGLAFAAGSILQAAAENVAMLISGRVLLGVGVAFAGVSVPLYNSEMAPPHLRGALSQLWQLVLTSGLLVAQLVNVGTNKIAAGWGWRLSLGLGVIPAIALIAGGIFLPDTPNSLIERGRPEEGRAVLRKIRGTDDIEVELSDIVHKAEAARCVANPWRSIIRRRFRPQLVLCFTTMVFQMWTGVDFVTAQAPLVLVTLGYTANDALNASIGVGALIFVSTLLSIWLADRAGRKPLLLVGGVFMALPLLGITVVLAVCGASQAWIAPFCLTMVYVFTVAFGATWGPIGWLYVTEIMTLETRTAGQAITTVVNMLLGWLMAQYFLTMLCAMQWGVFVMFSVSIVVITLATQAIYPETAGVPIEECPALFKTHWVWRRYADVDGIEDGGSVTMSTQRDAQGLKSMEQGEGKGGI